MARQYNTGAATSDIGANQLQDFYYQRKAITELKKEIYFTPMASVIGMPKHFGKTIKRYHYLPMLDDANINDQGIDANGAILSFESTITMFPPNGDGTLYGADAYTVMPKEYFVGNHATVEATAITAAKAALISWIKTYYPAVYAAMAHSTTAGDYTLQTTTGNEVAEIKNIAIGDMSEDDVFVLTWTPDDGDAVTLTSAALGATENIAAVATLFTGHADYADLPGLITTSSTDTLVLTWATDGIVNGTLVLTKTVGTGDNITTVATTGATTLYAMGNRFTLNDSVTGSGNLYGSSKDIGYISGKIPTLSETGGRVNRVGFKRIELEGSIEKFGFFEEYTQESIDFDTDSELMMHVNREMLRGATELTEDMLQIDILNAAGVNKFAGDAVSKATITGTTGSVCEVTYADLSALSIELDNNRCPKDTKVMSGTRMVDSLTIPAARAMFIGSEMIPTIERMTDHFSNQAFIPVQKYAAGTKILQGEIGTVGAFRIIVVPEMMHWAGAGAGEGTANAGYLTSGGSYNVYPLLVVGSESFTTIGYQTSGSTTKFKVYHKRPGKEMVTTDDPFGETGLMSIKWYYGFMALRTERLAVIYSVGRV